MSMSAHRFEATSLSARIERLTARELDTEIMEAGAAFDAARTDSQRIRISQRLEALRAESDER